MAKKAEPVVSKAAAKGSKADLKKVVAAMTVTVAPTAKAKADASDIRDKQTKPLIANVPAKTDGNGKNGHSTSQMSLFDVKTDGGKSPANTESEAATPGAIPPEPKPAVRQRAARKDNGKDNGAGSAADYTGDNIQILEGVQHIRQRPGMYIGSTSTSGILHLIYEAIDNVVDEFTAGFGSTMHLTIEQNGRVTVRDEARGIPIDPKESGGIILPTAAWIFLKPFTGGKFDGSAYKQAGGLHGVGLTVINALSSELVVDIWRDSQHYHQEFRHGRSYAKPVVEPYRGSQHGTQIAWLYDQTIFDEDVAYDIEALTFRFEATACLNRGLKIEFTYWDDEACKDVHHTFHSEKGLVDYVQRLMPGGSPLIKQPISITKSRDDVALEVVLQPDSRSYKSQILSFANGVRTTDGGTHEIGFKAALTKLINDYALKWGIIKDRAKEQLKPDIIQQGLTAIIAVKLSDPQFQSQTKNRLNNAPIEGITRSIVLEGLTEWFETNATMAKEWVKKIYRDQKARNEALMIEDMARSGQKKNGDVVDLGLSKKFAACNSNDPRRNELFIVEGESAGGSAKQARRSEFQAILALKGKPVNAYNATVKSLAENEEIRTILAVIGTGARDHFDYDRLKFKKIILMADADVDGSHIVCLLLTLFYQEMPDLIEKGNVYIACPPLYSVKYKGKLTWLIDDEAKRQFLRQHPEAANLEFKRYKGLGEMNPGELRETTMDQARRVLKRVTMEDSALAAKIVVELMAKENAEARRALLAKQSKHLAVAGSLV